MTLNQSILQNVILLLSFFTLSGCTDNSTTEQQATNETDLQPAYNQVTETADDGKRIVITPIQGQKIRVGQRVALLIANQDYQDKNSLSTLQNPIRDAELLKNKFEKQGFIVTLVSNADEQTMRQYIKKFVTNSINAESAVFYYSGHGVQNTQRNDFLAPIDASFQGDIDTDIDSFGVSINQLIEDIDSATPRISLVIIDACRSLPEQQTNTNKGAFSRGGLAQKATSNTNSRMLIAYATQPGKIALDKVKGVVENNSPFAQAIANEVNHIGQVGLRDLFDRVADNVETWTDRQQKPTFSGDVRNYHYLINNDNQKAAIANQQAALQQREEEQRLVQEQANKKAQEQKQKKREEKQRAEKLKKEQEAEREKQKQAEKSKAELKAKQEAEAKKKAEQEQKRQERIEKERKKKEAEEERKQEERRNQQARAEALEAKRQRQQQAEKERRRVEAIASQAQNYTPQSNSCTHVNHNQVKKAMLLFDPNSADGATSIIPHSSQLRAFISKANESSQYKINVTAFYNGNKSGSYKEANRRLNNIRTFVSRNNLQSPIGFEVRNCERYDNKVDIRVTQ